MTQKLLLSDALNWFSKQISSALASYRNNAHKNIRTIQNKIEDLITAAHRFDYSDIKDPDVYQNYATTIFNKTIEIFGKIEPPEVVTYYKIEEYHNMCKNQITTYMNLLSKYLSWLKRDRSYKDKVKNLDRVLGRLKEEVHKFENKTMVHYSEIIKYERVIDDIEELQINVKRRTELNEEIDSHSDDIKRLTKIVEEKSDVLKELKDHPGFVQFEQNKDELEKIEIILSSKVSEIKKLSNKVIKAAESKKIEINVHDKETLKNLIKDPLGVLIRESDGYRGLKAILNTLKESSTLPAIQMKKDKLKRAYENIDEILNDELLEYQQRAKFLIQQNDAINDKFREMEIDVKIKRNEKEIDNLKIDIDRITLPLRRELEQVGRKIATAKETIEKRVLDFTDQLISLIFE
ncbi:MAG: hypothetical protein KAS95_02370 [Candidatus Heimdallarchaeota archaeon]|nr:hypothetical protein [Candidatus Heimdallarchaeota archaeon]